MKEYRNSNMNTLALKKILLKRPIVAGPVYRTQWHIKDTLYHYGTTITNDFTYSQTSFNFKSWLNRHCRKGTKLSTYDIKSLYINIIHNLFYNLNLIYWTDKLQHGSLLLHRLSKQFFLEGLSVLRFIYFCV